MAADEQIYCTVIGRPWEHKESIRCNFCGGKKCMRCGDTAYTVLKSDAAFEKFHSTWITPDIVAMQRPSDELIASLNLVEKFSKAGVTAVFNLTQPGEHPFCGDSLKPSGFPYTPENLMNAGIKHFNYSWKDMGVPSMSLMMDIVQVARTEIHRGGKVAVHCHAGFGRTGLSIASIMVANDLERSSDDIISHIRKTRHGSIQTAAQENFIKDFERQYLLLCNTFGADEFVLQPISAASVVSSSHSLCVSSVPSHTNPGSPAASHAPTTPLGTPVKTGGISNSRPLSPSPSEDGLLIIDPSLFPKGLVSPGGHNRVHGTTTGAIVHMFSGSKKSSSLLQPMQVETQVQTNTQIWRFPNTVDKTIHDTVKSQHFTLLSTELAEFRYVPKPVVVAGKVMRACVDVLLDQPDVSLFPQLLSFVRDVNEYELCLHCCATVLISPVKSDRIVRCNNLYLQFLDRNHSTRLNSLRILRQKVNFGDYSSHWLADYPIGGPEVSGELWLGHVDRCGCLCMLLLNWLDTRQDGLLPADFMSTFKVISTDVDLPVAAAAAVLPASKYLEAIRQSLSRVKASTLGQMVAILRTLQEVNKPHAVDAASAQEFAEGKFLELLVLRFAASMLPRALRTVGRFIYYRVTQDTSTPSLSASVSSLLQRYMTEPAVYETTVAEMTNHFVGLSKEKGYNFTFSFDTKAVDERCGDGSSSRSIDTGSVAAIRRAISPLTVLNSSDTVTPLVGNTSDSGRESNRIMIVSVIQELLSRYDLIRSLINPSADVSGMDMGIGPSNKHNGIRWTPNTVQVVGPEVEVQAVSMSETIMTK